MSSPHTRWIDAKTWICTRHLPSVRMDASIGMCAFSTCDSVRPRRESFDRVVAVAVNSQASKPSAPVQKKSVSKKTSAPKVEAAATTLLPQSCVLGLNVQRDPMAVRRIESTIEIL